MAEIIIADITCHDGYSPRVLNVATQGFVTDGAPIADPTLDSRLTVSRSTSAYRTKSNGVMELVAANLPRFDYDPVSGEIKGLLVEEGRTNLLVRSQEFDNASWALTGLTITANATTAPDGTTTADRSNNTAGAVSLLNQNNTIAASSTNDYYVSVYVKPVAPNVDVTLNCYYIGSAEDNVTFNFTTMTASGVPYAGEYIFEALANGWYRIGYRITRDATGVRTQISWRLWPSGRAQTSGDMYLWGAQLELGAHVTSYIPTVASTVARSPDVVSMPTASWFNATEGTLIAEATTITPTTATRRFAQLCDALFSNRILLGLSAATTARFFVQASGVTQADLTGSVPGPAQPNRLAGAYKVNDFQGYANGVSIGADTSGSVPSVTQLVVGSEAATAGPQLCGHVRRVTYYPRRLTNAEMQQATTGEATPSGATLDLNFMGTAHAYYDGRISQPGNTQRNIFNTRSTFGRTQVGYGELALVNNDGALDYLKDFGFAGFGIVIKRGVITQNMSAPTWTTVMSGVMESADFSWSEVSIKLRDRQQELDKPLQQSRYGGTNSLPNGLDGVPGDLQGKCKPILYGKAYNFAPPCVNTTRQIYQISDGLIQSVDTVLDRGSALTAGAAYSSQADMETNVPSAGQYRVWLSSTGSYIRLGTTPQGILTVDATQGAASANRTAAQLMLQVLQKGGIAAADIDSADVTALDAAANYVVGYWVGHDVEMTGLQVLDLLANSVGAWWGVDRLGKFRMAQVQDPASGTSIGAITAVDILKIDRVRSTDAGSGIPAWQVKLNYALYQRVLDDLGSTVSVTVKSERAQQYRQRIANDSAVLTKWPKAVEIEFDTCIAGQSDAQTEVTRRLPLYKVVRDTLTVSARLDDAMAAAIDMGKVVTVELPRFNYGSGKKFLVTGIRTNLRNNIFDLTLWG
jgi:hypothetical protein